MTDTPELEIVAVIEAMVNAAERARGFGPSAFERRAVAHARDVIRRHPPRVLMSGRDPVVVCGGDHEDGVMHDGCMELIALRALWCPPDAAVVAVVPDQCIICGEDDPGDGSHVGCVP